MLTPDDLASIRALVTAVVRAELAVALQGASAATPLAQGGHADHYAGLRALIGGKRLVTGREAAAALLGCPVGDVRMADVMHAAKALRALGWERCKVTRPAGGGRGWHYRPTHP